MAQTRPEKPWHGMSRVWPWRLRIWGEPITDAMPDGYGVLAEQVTLFAPAAGMEDALRAKDCVAVETPALGQLVIQVDFAEWRTAYRLEWGPAISLAT